jgi:hypothetical protein
LALVALAFPLSAGPFIHNFAGFLLEILPALFLVSPRFAKLIPTFPGRVFLALLYLLLPNTAEIQGNMTNAQCFLAILAFLVLVAPEDDRKMWRALDSSVLILSGLSGAFSMLLFPVAFLLWLQKRSKERRRNLALIAVTATIQTVVLLSNKNSRSMMLPGQQLELVLPILGRQVIWGALIGIKGFAWVMGRWWFDACFGASIFAALLVVAYALWKAPVELKSFLLFGGAEFSASLISPAGNFSTSPPLVILYHANSGNRYWVIPMCAFVLTLIWALTRAKDPVVRVLSGAFLATMIFGIVADFSHPPLVDYQFNANIQFFESLPPGQKMTFPINPPGWTMELHKH